MKSKTPKFSGLPQGRVLLAVSLILSCALMIGYTREGDGGPVHSVQNVFMSLASPFQMVGGAVGGAGASLSNTVADMNADEATMTELKEQNAQLRSLVAQTEEYRQEVDRLSDLLKIQKSYDIDGVSARVIGYSSQAWNQTVTIDAGESSGVDAGQTVMGPSGVIGQVVAVGPATATVRLLSDPQSGVAAMVQSSREEGIVRGSLEGLLYLENLDAAASVQVGDQIVTSGLGGSYTSGLLVGTVVKVDQTLGEESRRIVVSANANSASLSEVIVVKGLGASNSQKNDSSGQDSAQQDATNEGGQ